LFCPETKTKEEESQLGKLNKKRRTLFGVFCPDLLAPLSQEHDTGIKTKGGSRSSYHRLSSIKVELSTALFGTR
jgi:hypothetical protein